MKIWEESCVVYAVVPPLILTRKDEGLHSEDKGAAFFGDTKAVSEVKMVGIACGERERENKVENETCPHMLTA